MYLNKYGVRVGAIFAILLVETEIGGVFVSRDRSARAQQGHAWNHCLSFFLF